MFLNYFIQKSFFFVNHDFVHSLRVVFLMGKVIPYLVLPKPSALLKQLSGSSVDGFFFFGAQKGCGKNTVENYAELKYPSSITEL